MKQIAVAMMAAMTVGAVLANPPNPQVAGGMFGVKRVEGKPCYTPPPADAVVLFDGTEASATDNWLAQKPKEKGCPFGR